MQDPAHASEVERRIVSVLFADLVGFTTLSEQLDAEDVATIQDAYFSVVRETVGRHGGVLEKFIGDAAMAVFGVPRARDDDAERAVRAGLALVSGVEQLGARLGLAAGSLRLRVGVNTGEVVHATGGPDAGRVTGDTVNTAARLQTAAEPDTVLVGEVTALAVDSAVELAAPAPLELKGKAAPVRARRVVALRPEPSRDAAFASLRAPLLGRERELESIEAAIAGPGRGLLVIVAPPGVGKSRLVAAVAARAEATGALVLRARIRPQPATPFEVVADLLVAAGAGDRLDAALAAAAFAPARQSVIREAVEGLLGPSSRRSTVNGTGPGTDLPGERSARFQAWGDALAALAGDRRSIWVVEDVHWATADMLAFLEHAVTADDSADRAILATARPSLLEAAPEWLASAQQLDLATLPAADAVMLVDALVGGALPADLVAAIAERSDGNPLFVEELLRAWIGAGTLVPAAEPDSGWRLAVAPGDVVLPPTVQAIYAAQLDDLPEEARRVARRASVMGRRFATAAFEPLGLEGHDGGLATLRRRAFVSGPEAGEAGDPVFAYRHALLRDAGYSTLARLERARLHAALARWMEATAGPGRSAAAHLVARHYADAAASLPAIGPPTEGLRREELEAAAADAFERAASASLGASAHEDAAALLRRSLEHTADSATVDRARRRLRLGAIVADAADLDEGITELTAATEALTEHLPAAAGLYAEAAWRLGMALMQQIRFEEAERTTAEALGRLAEADPPGRVRLHALHAYAVAAQGRDDGAADEARAARRDAAGIADPGIVVDTLEQCAAALDELGSPDPAVWDELEQRARAAGRWRQVATAARVRARLLADDSPANALPPLDAATEEANAHGLTEQGGWLELARCETLWVLGRWDDALEAGWRAIALGERHAYDRLTFRTWMVLLPLLAARRTGSQRARYERWLAAAAARLPAAPSPYAQVLRAATERWLALAEGDAEPADPPDDELATVIPPFANPHFVAAVETLVEWWLAAGRDGTAREAASRWAAYAAESDATPLMRASAALIDAWLAPPGSTERRAAAERALAEARRLGAAWWEARALAALGDHGPAAGG